MVRRFIGVMLLAVSLLTGASLSSASIATAQPRQALASAEDRALLKTALQRSWNKQNAAGRYKICWMWVSQRALTERQLLQTFAQYGVAPQDVLTVARSHFARVC